MKLRVLGCGTSSGVPRIGNDWGRCNPADPRNRRSRSALLVESARERLLIDCGPDLREQLLAADVSTLDRVIVTHDHADHLHGIDDLRQVALVMRRPVRLAARAITLDRIVDRFRYAFVGSPLYPTVLMGEVLVEEEQLGAARLRFVDQPHGGITSLGIRIDEGERSAAYAIDYHDMTEAMAALYMGLDLLISDCLRRRPHPTHAHLDAVLGWAKDLKVGQLVLTHLDNSMDFTDLAETLPSWASPAFDGAEYRL
ncbi:MBL fold metallo-hydrolase [Sphingomonas sp. RB1R13]|uniref:MBL fold metallo-hydrolase n=1 Tax=Sphingomonas sp. RB1R13 TaxID=3096159 RepID=UPI002FC9FA6B